jgi:hypothetical protein
VDRLHREGNINIFQVNLENIMLSERNQTQKTTYYMFLFIDIFRTRRPISGCQELGVGDRKEGRGMTT